jgi:DNA relaxase NicK
MPLQTNVTRLDLQVTVTFNEVQKRMIVKAYNRALKAPKVRGRRPEYKLITNSREGDSLYFGRPQSDIVGRMYDKGIESKLAPAGKIVRWEVQMRRDAAKLTAARMMESETPDTLAGASVAEHFRRRQITPPRFEITEVDGARVVSRSDNAGRMAYFRVVVSKMVEKCLTTYTRDEVIEALGLELDDVSSYKQA